MSFPSNAPLNCYQEQCCDSALQFTAKQIAWETWSCFFLLFLLIFLCSLIIAIQFGITVRLTSKGNSFGIKMMPLRDRDHEFVRAKTVNK